MNIQDNFNSLKENFANSCNTEGANIRKILVQVGHCSKSVGAEEIFQYFDEHANEFDLVSMAGCDGACFNAPQVNVIEPNGSIRKFGLVDLENAASILDGDYPPESDIETYFSNQQRIALSDCGNVPWDDLEGYINIGGFKALLDVLQSEPIEVIEKVLDSGLRGRGGAYFPAGLKWKAVSDLDESNRYLVVNCEEGEPGVFKDRHLMEGLPFRIIEGALIAAYCSKASEIFIYVNAEAHLSSSRIEDAVKKCYEVGLCGQDVLGSGYGLDVFILHGAGGYVCGEETTLLNTMEGFRREPRVRPPFPTEAGYLNQPTVINNAETLANIPYIISEGSEHFKTIGLTESPGCKIISLSGSVDRPGVVEVPMGTSVRHIVEQIGNVPKNTKVGAVAVGGPSSGIMPEKLIDTIIKPGFILQPGVILGAGGVIVIPEGKNILNAVKLLTEYNATESCGKCTPCREGNPRMLQLLSKLNPEQFSSTELDEINNLATTINASSLCGLGQASGNPILSLGHHFVNDDSQAHIGLKSN